MMGVRVEINNSQIGYIGILNTGEQRVAEREHEHKVKYDLFDLRGYEDWGGTMNDYNQIGEVWHYPSDGGATLAGKAMELVEEDHLDSSRPGF